MTDKYCFNIPEGGSKSLDILEWLNLNEKREINYSDWIKRNIKITSKHMFLIFQNLIFMKVHRFYEVFHKDADVVVEELSNCIYMYGRTAHTGFPESCLERFTDELSEKGYDII